MGGGGDKVRCSSLTRAVTTRGSRHVMPGLDPGIQCGWVGIGGPGLPTRFQSSGPGNDMDL